LRVEIPSAKVFYTASVKIIYQIAFWYWNMIRNKIKRIDLYKFFQSFLNVYWVVSKYKLIKLTCFSIKFWYSRLRFFIYTCKNDESSIHSKTLKFTFTNWFVATPFSIRLTRSSNCFKLCIAVQVIVFEISKIER
jgi:hypothetical protein